MEEPPEDLLTELKSLKAKVDQLQVKVLANVQRTSDDGSGSAAPDLDELREIVALMLDKQNKLESTFGVEKVSLKDAGDRILVTIDTNFGCITTHTDKTPAGGGGTHSPVTYSGSTVAGAGGPTPGIGGGKGGGSHGMTPEQLQEFKKQSLQIGAAQQKLRELETKLNDATNGIRRGVEKTTDMEEKQTENIKELYTCLDGINTSLSEKIALQKVEVQKIAGDTPKPINYDPFNYGEAYAGDLVDFQARKRITELKLLMHGLQTALLQMRDSMKVSPSIDLGYKVVRLDQLVGSTGFGQKVNNGEVSTEEGLLVEQSGERVPGKVEYPRKSMNQTSPEMESKWSITDSMMQTMYRLEMELGEIQKIVDSTGLSSGSKVIEDVQQSIKQLKDRQIDIRTIKRLIEDSKESSINLMSGRKSTGPSGVQRNTLPQIHGDNSDASLVSSRKVEQSMRQMQTQLNQINRRMSGSSKNDEAITSACSAAAKKHAKGKNCLSCDRSIKSTGQGQECAGVGPSVPIYSYFNPNGQRPRIKGPTYTQFTLHRSYRIDINREHMEQYNIPRPCGSSYQEYWPLPKTFAVDRFQGLFEPPSMVADTKYIRGSDGRYYRGSTRRSSSQVPKRDVAMTVAEVKPGERSGSVDSKAQGSQDSSGVTHNLMPDSEEPVAVVVRAASTENAHKYLQEQAQEMEEENARQKEVSRRASLEMKKYKVKLPAEDDEDRVESSSDRSPKEADEKEEEKVEEVEGGGAGSRADVKEEETGGEVAEVVGEGEPEQAAVEEGGEKEPPVEE